MADADSLKRERFPEGRFQEKSTGVIEITKDNFLHISQVNKSIQAHLNFLYPCGVPLDIFFSKICHWLKVYQVKKELQREAAWEAFKLHYHRCMNEEEQKRLFKEYPAE